MERAETVCKQIAKFALSASALIVLVVINHNVHQLLQCMLQQPIDSIITPPSTTNSVPGVNCTSEVLQTGIQLRIDVCVSNRQLNEAPVISLYLNKTILRVYSETDTKVLVDLLRRCTGKDFERSCQLFKNDKGPCWFYAQLNKWDHICYSEYLIFDYFVINGLRLFKKESVLLLEIILKHPAVISL
jgi:hypothetical protein